MSRKTITEPVRGNDVPELGDIIRAGAIALDVSDADLDLLDGVVVGGQVYDLAETPELARTIRAMYIDDPDPVVRAAAGVSGDVTP